MERFSPDFLIKDLYDMLLEECEQYERGELDDPYDPWSHTQTPEEYRRERLEGRKRGEEICLIRYRGNDEHVCVPAGVTNIGRGAFADNTTLRSVILPDSVRRIESAAFKNCYRLSSVGLGSNMEVVGVSSFENCISLRKIVFPDTAMCIGPSAFEKCTLLTDVDLGKGMEEIAEGAFKKCKSLKEITLPESLQKFDLQAFEGSGVRALYVPKNVFYITSMELSRRSPVKKIEVDPRNPHLYSKGNGVFLKENDALLGVVGKFTVPQDGSLQEISENMFKGNLSLTEYYIPEGVKTIWDGAFSGCKNLRSVSFPSTLGLILPLAFEKCTSLEEIVVPGSVRAICDFAFAGAGLRRVILKRGVREIGHAAFFNCASLEEVYLPCTLEQIEYFQVFDNCSENLSIYIERSREKNYKKILKYLEKYHVKLIKKSEIFD